MKKYIRFLLDFINLYWMILRKKELHLTLNGGLGDVILDIYYLSIIKKRYPKCKLIIYYRDDDLISNPENFSLDITRKYSTVDGERINPILEILSGITEIDNLIGTNISNYTYGIRVYPAIFRKYFGYPQPNKFHTYLKNMLIKQDNTRIEKIKKEMSKYNINIALHLRRNSQKILEFAELVEKYNPNVNFILLGSTEHQKIPEIKLKNTISLIDSYSKNLNLLDVFKISTDCTLFIGGRGGFEVFHWLIKVPTLCFFDDVGFNEIKIGWWDKSLWQQNKINKLFSENSNIEDIYNYEIKNKLFD